MSEPSGEKEKVKGEIEPGYHIESPREPDKQTSPDSLTETRRESDKVTEPEQKEETQRIHGKETLIEPSTKKPERRSIFEDDIDKRTPERDSESEYKIEKHRRPEGERESDYQIEKLGKREKGNVSEYEIEKHRSPQGEKDVYYEEEKHISPKKESDDEIERNIRPRGSYDDTEKRGRSEKQEDSDYEFADRNKSKKGSEYDYRSEKYRKPDRERKYDREGDKYRERDKYGKSNKETELDSPVDSYAEMERERRVTRYRQLRRRKPSPTAKKQKTDGWWKRASKCEKVLLISILLTIGLICILGALRFTRYDICPVEYVEIMEFNVGNDFAENVFFSKRDVSKALKSTNGSLDQNETHMDNGNRTENPENDFLKSVFFNKTDESKTLYSSKGKYGKNETEPSVENQTEIIEYDYTEHSFFSQKNETFSQNKTANRYQTKGVNFKRSLSYNQGPFVTSFRGRKLRPTEYQYINGICNEKTCPNIACIGFMINSLWSLSTAGCLKKIRHDIFINWLGLNVVEWLGQEWSKRILDNMIWHPNEDIVMIKMKPVPHFDKRVHPILMTVFKCEFLTIGDMAIMVTVNHEQNMNSRDAWMRPVFIQDIIYRPEDSQYTNNSLELIFLGPAVFGLVSSENSSKSVTLCVRTDWIEMVINEI